MLPAFAVMTLEHQADDAYRTVKAALMEDVND
jgi:hypothetical protein